MLKRTVLAIFNKIKWILCYRFYGILVSVCHYQPYSIPYAAYIQIETNILSSCLARLSSRNYRAAKNVGLQELRSKGLISKTHFFLFICMLLWSVDWDDCQPTLERFVSLFLCLWTTIVGHYCLEPPEISIKLCRNNAMFQIMLSSYM